MSEWIKCSDRMPGECISVLAVGKGGKVFNLYQKGGGWELDGPFNPSNPRNDPKVKFLITHWMPLPQPPQDQPK